MRQFSHLVFIAMILYGFYQIAPLMSIHLWNSGKIVPGEILVFDLIPEGDQFRMYIVYEYIIETPSARVGVLGSQMSDIAGNVQPARLLDAEERRAFLPLLEDSDAIREYLPEPMVFVDADRPLQTGRLYLAFDHAEFRYGILCIAVPILIWLCGMLIRSFISYQREPSVLSHVSITKEFL